MWLVFSEAQVFDPMFHVRMIFIDKMVMISAIKSRAIADRRSMKLTKNDWKRVTVKYADREY